jgi:hypothetical protein
METSIRKRSVALITFLSGLYFFVEFLLPAAALESIGLTPVVHDRITNGFIVVGTLAFGLGLINLTSVHGSTIVFRRKGWQNSVALLLGLLLMFLVAAIDWRADLIASKKSSQLEMLSDFTSAIIKDKQESKQGVPPWEVRVAALFKAVKDQEQVIVEDLEDSTLATMPSGILLKERFQKVLSEIGTNQSTSIQEDQLAQIGESLRALSQSYGEYLRESRKHTLNQKLWSVLFDGLYEALGAAMFSLLGIYIAAAAYRAFRIRSFESSLMMIAAVVVMLGQIPFGSWIYSEMPELRLWLLEVPSGAAFRAIKVGAAVAGVVMAFRMWLSLESNFGSRKG